MPYRVRVCCGCRRVARPAPFPYSREWLGYGRRGNRRKASQRFKEEEWGGRGGRERRGSGEERRGAAPPDCLTGGRLRCPKSRVRDVVRIIASSHALTSCVPCRRRKCLSLKEGESCEQLGTAASSPCAGRSFRTGTIKDHDVPPVSERASAMRDARGWFLHPVGQYSGKRVAALGDQHSPIGRICVVGWLID